MMYEIGNNENDDVNKYYKKTLKKINSEYFVEKYINQICNNLQKKRLRKCRRIIKIICLFRIGKKRKIN